MATLEKIRNRAGLLVSIIIGMALLAFVLGDLFKSGQSLFTNSQYEIANIAGKSIPFKEFQKDVEDLTEITKIQYQKSSLDPSTLDNIRNQVWQRMVQDYVMKSQYKKLGLAVSGDELFDLIQGRNPHPIIKQLFTNPETGVLNRSALLNFLRQVEQEGADSQQKTYWLFIENEILSEREMTKYDNLIKKGLYVTKIDKERKFSETHTQADFNYIVQYFNSVSDSAVTVDESDLKKYYEEHKNEYKQEKSRDIKYVTFEVIPSEKDNQAAKKWIDDIKPDFEKVSDVKQFVNLNSDVPYNDQNFKDGELPELLNKEMFDAKVGFVYGPYFENNAYKLAKLAEINYLPDSVKARHILLQANQNNVRQVYAMADSLKNLIEHGADFAKLAKEYSVDATARNGGDLGWFHEGAMVKSFSDSCFYGKVGDVKIVPSQYGIHVVQILKQSKPVKKVQVGILVRNVVPSDVTDQVYYSKASEFAGVNNTYEKFNNAVKKENLVVHDANNLHPMDKTINGLESPRELVKWAFNADLHDVSKVFKFDEKYVVATVVDVRKKGFASFDEKKAEIQVAVLKEKKAQKITDGLKAILSGVTSIDALADKLQTSVNTALGVRFDSRTVGDAGIEPDIAAASVNVLPNKLSTPVEGNSGIFVLDVTKLDKPTPPTGYNYMLETSILEKNYAARANYEPFQALKDMADIDDNRAKFY